MAFQPPPPLRSAIEEYAKVKDVSVSEALRRLTPCLELGTWLHRPSGTACHHATKGQPSRPADCYPPIERIKEGQRAVDEVLNQKRVRASLRHHRAKGLIRSARWATGWRVRLRAKITPTICRYSSRYGGLHVQVHESSKKISRAGQGAFAGLAGYRLREFEQEHERPTPLASPLSRCAVPPRATPGIPQHSALPSGG